MTVRNEHGVALIAVSMVMLLVMAIGAALIVASSTEAKVAANFRAGNQAFYAADAIAERTIGELRATADWDALLSGSIASSLSDGTPSGTRRLADGSIVNLDRILSLANCQRTTPCSDSDVAATTLARPWGANNPRWRLFAFGWLADAVSPVPTESLFYVVSLVADDPAENDGDPARDGAMSGGQPNPGRDVVLVRGESFGPRHSHRAVEVAVARFHTVDPVSGTVTSGQRVLSWREVH